MKKTSLIAALILMWSGAAYAQEAAATDSEAVASETTNAQPVSERNFQRVCFKMRERDHAEHHVFF